MISQMISYPIWQTDHILPLTRNSLLQLIDARIPALRIERFATTVETQQLKRVLFQLPTRSQSISQVTRIGISQYEEGLRGSKQYYFDKVAELTTYLEMIFRQSFNPNQRLMDLFKAMGLDADIMMEPGYGSYYAGVGKSREGYSPIHVDFAPQDSRDWEVGRATAQLAWNLYLNTPSGGKLLLWEKLWQSSDDIYQVSHSYYYTDEVVSKSRKLEIDISEGELVIINSRNYHAVSETSNRLAFGSFISYFPEDKLRLWS